MKKIIFLTTTVFLFTACVSLTFQEKEQIAQLKYQGVSVDRGPAGWEKPNSALVAGMLNLLPGIGNFYLASGNAGDSSQWVYGFGNLLLWPLSVIWGIPEAAIDANTINNRDMLQYLHYGHKSIPSMPVEQPYNYYHYAPRQTVSPYNRRY